MGEAYRPRSPDLSDLHPPPHSDVQSTPAWARDTHLKAPSNMWEPPPHLRQSASSYYIPPSDQDQPPELPTQLLPSDLAPPSTELKPRKRPKYEDEDADWEAEEAELKTPAVAGKKRSIAAMAGPTPITKKEEEMEDGKLEHLPAPGDTEGAVVKTKFPVARIKRIVQADEDVGKVAQSTPVVISKALELFMISLSLKAAEEARKKGQKRVTSAHLKRVVENEETFDFLGEIISKVPDAPEKESKAKAERPKSDDDDDDDEDGPRKKRKKARGRPRKFKDDDD